MRRHGTYATYSTGCRCEDCKTAASTYKKHWLYEKTHGRPRTVPVDTVRPHLQRLLDSGWTRQAIYRATGVSCASQRRILGIGKEVGQVIRPQIADRLLAMQPKPPVLLPTNVVPVQGTQLRIRALMAIGWKASDMSRRTGTNVSCLLLPRRKYVTVANRDRIAAMYDELWDTPGPSDTTRRRAVAAGWLPPLALDDDCLDDPAYTPDRRHVPLATHHQEMTA